MRSISSCDFCFLDLYDYESQAQRDGLSVQGALLLLDGVSISSFLQAFSHLHLLLGGAKVHQKSYTLLQVFWHLRAQIRCWDTDRLAVRLGS